MPDKKWRGQSLPMTRNHNWKAKPGYNIFVADRGAVRFSYPNHWLVRPTEDCIRFYDAEPPDDNFTLGMSYIRLPPIDWSGLPLESMVEEMANDDEREILDVGQVVQVARQDMEIAWVELRHIDPVAKRPAYGRYGLARGSNIQVLLTLDYWPEDRDHLHEAWHEILHSLILGRILSDPMRGDVLH